MRDYKEYQEALDTFANIHEVYGPYKVFDKPINEVQVDFKKLQELVEKEKPMKPKEIHIDKYRCPKCGNVNTCNDGIVEDIYCPKCGKRLSE